MGTGGGAGATYDLVVARAVSREVLRSDAERSCRRLALTAPEHRIEQPLLPDERCHWAVRVRRGEQVTDWSNYASDDAELVWDRARDD